MRLSSILIFASERAVGESITESVTAVLCIGLVGFTIATALLGGGLITLHRNLKLPSAQTKRWGAVLAALNVLQGATGAAVSYALFTREPRPENDVLGFLALGTLVAIGLGIVGIVAAIRAKPTRA